MNGNGNFNRHFSSPFIIGFGSSPSDAGPWSVLAPTVGREISRFPYKGRSTTRLSFRATMPTYKLTARTVAALSRQLLTSSRICRINHTDSNGQLRAEPAANTITAPADGTMKLALEHAAASTAQDVRSG